MLFALSLPPFFLSRFFGPCSLAPPPGFLSRPRRLGPRLPPTVALPPGRGPRASFNCAGARAMAPGGGAPVLGPVGPAASLVIFRPPSGRVRGGPRANCPSVWPLGKLPFARPPGWIRRFAPRREICLRAAAARVLRESWAGAATQTSEEAPMATAKQEAYQERQALRPWARRTGVQRH